MKFLVLLALVSAACARPEYHDDVFHFSSLQGLESLRGLSRATVQKVPASSITQVNTYAAQPVQVLKTYSAPAVTQIKKTTYSAQPVQVFNAYSSAPAVTQIKKTTYTQPIQVLKTFSAPAVTQVNTYAAQPVQVVKSYSAPAVTQVSSSSVYGQQPNFRILKQVQEHDPLGYYRFNYETENGIQAKENGVLSSQSGPEGASVITEGSYSYTGPDGVVYTVNYTADENGFQAAGDHLPTPPPIPAEILRSLEIQAAEAQKKK